MKASTNAAGPPNALLEALQAEERELLEAHLQVVRLKRGDVLGEPDQPITQVYFPHDAVVSLTVATADGETAEAATIGREGMVGFVAAFGDRRAFARSLVQVTGRATRLPLARLEAAFERYPRVRELCLAYVQALLGQALQSVACGTLHPAEMRLARWLLMLHDRATRDELQLTHDFLASMLGVRRATVAVALAGMRKAGLVTQRRGSIVIADRAGLEARSCECYRVVQAYHARVLPYGST
jgi:CRP-like cAMP-binding protein